jgi:hypothetical protein
MSGTDSCLYINTMLWHSYVTGLDINIGLHPWLSVHNQCKDSISKDE